MNVSALKPGELVHAPWMDPAFGYVMVLLGGLLVLTAIGLAVVTARGRGGESARTLWKRWATWAVLGPTFAVVVYSGTLPVAILMALFAVQGTGEWATLTGLPATHRRMLAAYSVVTPLLALFGAVALLATVPLLLLGGMLIPVAAADTRRGMRDLADGALGFAYLPFLLSFAVLMVGDLPAGATLLFMTGAAVAASDIGAYIAGKTIGRRRLAPRLSPNKTVGGLAGNLLGALLAIVLLLPALPDPSVAALVVIALVVTVGAVWGDLFASALKREAGVKDAGALLPGFGGLLDRIDSFVLTVPLVYYTAVLVDLLGQPVATP